MAQTTLAEIRTRIRQRSDNEFTDGEFVDDPELLILINKSRKHLFGMLVESGQHTVAETIWTIPVDGSLDYALPDDCFSISGVFRVESESYIRLDRHDSRTHPRDGVESVAITYRTHGSLEAARIELYPRVDSGTYIVRYLGVPKDLEDELDFFDGVLGWEEWIVYDVAIDILMKEKQWEAVDRLQSRQDKITQRILAAASQRDMQENGAVANVRTRKVNSLQDDYGILPGGHRGIRGFWGSF